MSNYSNYLSCSKFSVIDQIILIMVIGVVLMQLALGDIDGKRTSALLWQAEKS
jgi:hypothetical protein